MWREGDPLTGEDSYADDLTHTFYGCLYIYRVAFSDIMPESLRNVTYKDIPSIRKSMNAHPEGQFDCRQDVAKRNRSIGDVFTKDDMEYWSHYIDFSRLYQAKPKNRKRLSQHEMEKFMALINLFNYCRRVDQVKKT